MNFCCCGSVRGKIVFVQRNNLPIIQYLIIAYWRTDLLNSERKWSYWSEFKDWSVSGGGECLKMQAIHTFSRSKERMEGSTTLKYGKANWSLGAFNHTWRHEDPVAINFCCLSVRNNNIFEQLAGGSDDRYWLAEGNDRLLVGCTRE